MAGALLAVAGLLALAAWGLTRRTPGWWREPEPGAAQAGQRLENAVVSELSRTRPAATPAPEKHYRSGEWTLTITQDEANAWLATRARGWLENRGVRWPQGVDSLRVAFEDGLVRIGARVTEDGVSRVVSAAAAVEVKDEGLWLHVSGVAVGGLRLPVTLVRSQFGGLMGDGQAMDIGAVLNSVQPVVKPAIVKLEDGRVIKVIGAKVELGDLQVTCRTEKE